MATHGSQLSRFDIYEDQGLKVALVMLATSAAGLVVFKILKRTFVRERPFIRHAGISLAGAPGAETRARCAAPVEVASSRGILGVFGDGAPASVVLRTGESNFFRSSNGVPPGPRFEWSAAPGNRSS